MTRLEDAPSHAIPFHHEEDRERNIGDRKDWIIEEVVDVSDAATGASGPQGPPGGFGVNGSFYDTDTLQLSVGTATPISINTTVFANGVSIVDGYKITFSQTGKFNIAFSSQIYNSSNSQRAIVLWLSKNGIEPPS